eukprot:jgi/Orpsp1_1/1186615/evm.model.d7180000051974.1
MNNEKCISIDLGTTYFCVGVWINNHIEIIPNDQDSKISSSYVTFTDSECIVGDAAKNQIAINPKNTVFDVKRLIGRRYNDPEIQYNKKYWPFNIIEKNDKPYIKVQYKKKIKEYTAEEISSMILIKIKNMVENYIGEEINNAIITVPANFNDSQRQATMDAGRIAGLNVLRLINDSAAAAFTYCQNNITNNEKKILIFDLGGGKLDVSILFINGKNIKIKATAGDTHLGGRDFDNTLINYYINFIKKIHNIDISSNPKSLRRLRKACENAKCELSFSKNTYIEIDSLYENIDLFTTITRKEFEDLNFNLFERIKISINKVLIDAQLDKSDIDEIVLVGGSTRIPKIQEILLNIFNNKKSLNKTINPDEAIAYGATLYASFLVKEKVKENINSLQLSNNIPLTLGIQTNEEIMTPIIMRNSSIPTKISYITTTTQDNQTSILFKIYEGERPLTKYNYYLDEFYITGIPPAPHGIPNIEITFDIEENGILRVSAIDRKFKIYNSIDIEYNINKRSKQEIKQIIHEAERNKEKDNIFLESIEAKNKLKNYIFRINDVINNKNISSYIKKNDREKINNLLNEKYEWIQKNPEARKIDYDKIRTQLENIYNPVISKIYKYNY